jgi:tRNA modification GTPase
MDVRYGGVDPIAARATAQAESALALIRTSGRGALEALAQVFSWPRALLAAPGNTVVYGWIVDGGKRIDEVLVSVYRAPRSYTGEDGADISCHGGIAAPAAVLRALCGAGFRDALPGEFSFRAFMNGKIDLTRAESVMEVVASKTDAGRRRAVGRLSGALEAEIQGVKEKLVGALAALELFLDYSEDDGAAGTSGAAGAETEGRLPDKPQVEAALAQLDALAAAWSVEKLYREGALVVIAGRPNTGKSSLFNRLLREDRAIVTDVPGTTRDWIEGWIALEGIPIRLVDTAGLRQTDNEVEQIGVERSRELTAQADLTLYLIDGTAGVTGGDETFITAAGGACIVVWNKADIAPPPERGAEGPAAVSAKTGAGIAELCARIAACLAAAASGASAGEGRTGAGTERQQALIDAARAALQETLRLAEEGLPLDVIAPSLREAVDALGGITGEVATADILDAMFSRFCVGK